MRFILIDRIDRLEPGVVAEGHKHIAEDEDYFRDHFPGYPIVPGVLVLESLAQLGGRLVEATVRHVSKRRVLPVLARVEHAKFMRPVHPGVRLDLSVELQTIGDDAARVTGLARVAGAKTASADILYALIDADEGSRHFNASQHTALREWSDRIWNELTRPTNAHS